MFVSDDADTMTEQRPNADQTSANNDQTLEPLSVADAAIRLGLSTDAVRMRIRRGTLPSAEIDGRRVVWLPPSDTDQTRPNDDATATEPDQTTGERKASESELVTQLRSEVTYLRQTLDAEIEARRRADHLVAGMIEERRGLMDQIAALSSGDLIAATEPRPNADRTQANADAQMQPPPEPEEEPTPTSITFGLAWRRWFRRIMGG